MATPAVQSPSKAKSGQLLDLSGAGFRAGTPVKIVFEAPRPVVVGQTVAGPGGSFEASVLVPASGPGKHTIRVTGTSALGSKLSVARSVTLVADQVALRPTSGDDALAEPVLLTIALVLPFATWLGLEVLSWRSRRAGKGHAGRR